MRSALLLPVTAVAVASVGLSLPTPPALRSEPTRLDSRTTARAPDAMAATRAGAAQVATGPTSAALPRSPPALRGRWAWPLAPRPTVARPFVRPATAYGTGHRGIDLAASMGQGVLAVEAGTVTHVGSIAGRGTVTVLHSSGIRSTYEPVDTTLSTGSLVARGAPLGRLTGSGSHCAPAVCLHLGALRGEVYLDPVVFLVGGQRVRLLPLSSVR